MDRALRRGAWASALAMIAIGVAIAVPASAGAVVKKPEIIRGWANTNQNGLVFSVKVAMGKSKKSTWDVDVTYNGVTDDADMLPNSRTIFETDPFSGPEKNCYSIRVKARNTKGTTTKTIKAGRIDTKGCPKKS